jgi:uncharacterized membrane protein (Fun14 family)
LTGFLIGYAVKKIMKILAVGAGIFFAALMYLESQNIVNINWDKLHKMLYHHLQMQQDNFRLRLHRHLLTLHFR